MRRPIALATVVGLLSLATACSDEETPVESETGPPLTVTVVQHRAAEGTRKIGVEVTNIGDTTLTVTSVRIIWGGLADHQPTPKDTELAPGRTIAFETTFGRPNCAQFPKQPTEAPVAEVGLAGRDIPITEPVALDGERLMRRLYSRGCEAIALRKVANVRLGDQWTRIERGGDPYLRGQIALDRRRDGVPVTVTSLRGSVLLDFRSERPGDPIATLAADQQSLRIPVLIGSSNRCDAHAFADSSQTFLLSAYVRRGGRPVQRVILRPDRPAQVRALDVARDACGGVGARG